jgi:hypothetical protein
MAASSSLNPGLRRADVTEITAFDPAALASSRGAASAVQTGWAGQALSLLSGVAGIAPAVHWQAHLPK